jgi:hypothetical protein
MTRIHQTIISTLLLFCSLFSFAQQPTAPAGNAVVPPLVKFSGTLTDLNGKALSETVGVTFALYKDQQGGAPLWLETQNVQLDKSGRYSVMLGSTNSTGLPADIFIAGEARWLGIQPQDLAEQPRVLLLSVPYAMKAGDAQTLGGLPSSAFVLAAPPVISAGASSASASASTSASGATPPTSVDVTTTGGTVNTLPLFSTASNIQNSILTQTGTSAINLAGKLILPSNGTATASKGADSQPEVFIGSVFNSTSSVAANQKFQWQVEPANNDTAAPSGTLNLLYASGTAAPAETGFFVSSTGQISFAPGQTFPGTGPGTITGITAGTDLTGGGTTGAVTLNVDTTKVPQLATANTFTGNQTVNGNLSATGVVTGSGFQIGSTLFDYGSFTTLNAFLGFGGNTTTTGGYDIAIGPYALHSNTNGSSNVASGYETLYNNLSGSNNTAIGQGALYNNTSGAYNTAIGVFALVPNTTGGENVGIGDYAGYPADGSSLTGYSNTAVGDSAGFSTGTLYNATAIGANALVSENNAIVLGGINGVHGSSVNTNVGIGTTAPQAALDVVGNGVQALIGDAGCGAGYAGIGFVVSGGFNSCKNYALLGETNGNVYINSSESGIIYFRNKNGANLMTIDTSGDVAIKGNLSKGGGSFKIDHPLDPANKYLYHSFVESPDMMNIYNGVATLDARGSVWIDLPQYFEALNQDFRYQLTSIGRPQPSLYVSREISGNRFRISGGKPGAKVSWQVTGIRHDAYADAHRIQVEVEKPPQEQGHYLHPELFGAGPEQTVGYPAQGGSGDERSRLATARATAAK